MKKIPVPKKEELLEFIVEELKERNIALSGNIDGFSKNLYKSFRKYIRGKEYKDKLFYEFAFVAIDSIVSDNVPSQAKDNSICPRAAGGE